MIDNSKEYILCAAVKRRHPLEISNPYWEGTNDILNIELGYRHHDIYQRFGNLVMDTSPKAQGFYTSKGRFVDRIEGMKIAYEAGQIGKKISVEKNNKYYPLFSEYLY